jgi:hypothetical protein
MTTSRYYEDVNYSTLKRIRGNDADKNSIHDYHHEL